VVQGKNPALIPIPLVLSITSIRKLYLHLISQKPSDMPAPLPQSEIPPLPKDVYLPQVYADFIKYLYNHTRDFFVESIPNGQDIWTRLESKIVLVFCHPAGWDDSQQDLLRGSAIRADIVPTEESKTRVEFVAEGEASVHYAFAHTASTTWTENGGKILVVHAGGYTTDIQLYKCLSAVPLKLEEIHQGKHVQVIFICADWVRSFNDDFLGRGGVH
jgi:hypothetical protein